MNFFLTSADIATIQLDMARLFDSMDTNIIAIAYAPLGDAVSTTTKHTVYKNPAAALNPSRTIHVPAIQKQVQDVEVENEKFRFAKLGDCMFVFQDQMDWSELESGITVAENSIIIEDRAGVRWKINKDATEDIDRTTALHLGDVFIAQIVIASPARETG